MSRNLGLRSIPIAGTPVNGTDEVLIATVNGAPTGGTFRLVFQSFITDTIVYNATAAVVQAALEALASIGSGGVVVTGNAGGPWTLTFAGNLGRLAITDLITLTDNLLTGGAAPDVTIAESVPGVSATQRGSDTGTTLIDTTNGVYYQNTGTALAPMWDKANAPLADAGEPGDNVLRVDANVASAETVTIGDDVYEVEIVNTDTGDDSQGGDFNNVTALLTVVDFVTNYPNSPATAGLLYRLENEIMKISDVDGNDVTFVRGVSGTTTAAHADALDLFEGDGVVAGNIPVGLVATLTPLAFIAALTADVNSFGTELVTAQVPSVTNAMYVYTSVSRGDGVPLGSAVAIATTETLGGADNVWAAATLETGRIAGTRDASLQIHTVTATEVALGEHRMTFPFTINAFITQAYTGAGVPKNNLTDQIVIENNNQIVWDGTGAINPAAGDKLHVLAWGN